MEPSAGRIFGWFHGSIFEWKADVRAITSELVLVFSLEECDGTGTIVSQQLRCEAIVFLFKGLHQEEV
jgi:hypothetical protein